MPLDPTQPPPGEPDELAGILTRAVEAAAGGDQAEVERMIAAHPAHAETIRQHLRRLDQLGLMAKGSDGAFPESIGPYRILGVLGQGGMGIVYLAEQREPVHRRVALKVIKLGMDRREVLATRFWLDARAQASAADEARAREAAKVREFDQLAGVVLLEQAEQREAALYPPWPERMADLRKWLADDAAPVLAMRPTIEQTLADLRGGAVPAGERDRRDPSSRIAAEARGFLCRALEDLPGKLIRFEATQHRSVVLRLQWAERIGSLTLAHPKARVGWDEARAAIAKADGVVASELYRGPPIALRAQMGLVPIGMNPVTKLWEFYELRSAWDGEGDPAAIEIPRHVPAGERAGCVKVADGTGIVFALLPGGVFTMGSQSTDATRPYFDPQRGTDEELDEIELPPFFLARHELTTGQWRRLTSGGRPSYHAAHDTNPVENVDWFDCERWLTRHGMVLPTEAEWEYGCRGGTTTPWWTGTEQGSLYRAANLRDEVLPEMYGDGFRLLAPVDALRPNPFGLHHVHGNVWEWCGDSRGSGRTLRGGGYDSAASAGRSAARYFEVPTVRHGRLGLRAARVLRP